MTLINKSQVKEKTELNVSQEFETELDKKVEQMIKDAEKRAKQNNRRTIYARDL